jgi:Tol biopolymer transport system component
VKTTPFAIKSNGKIAYFSDRVGSGSSLPTGVYAINANGSGDTLLKSGEFFGTAPAWSPDGTKLAFGRRGFDNFTAEIFVANADGSNSVKIAGNVYSQNNRVAWSPNGTKLAYIGTGNAIFIVNVDGSGMSRLPNSPTSINDLAWSPDGSRFAYSNGKDIYVMNIDGSGQTNLTQDRPRVEGQPVGSILPRWSPDGTRIVFGAQGLNNNEIHVMNANGSGLAPLITQHQSQQPAWGPDGAKITFVSLNSLYVANADGTGITHIGGGGLYNMKPDWQPLGAAPASIQLSSNNYNISEAGARLPITVTRSSSIGTATVNYATSDNAALTPCNTFTTLASSRCDYATTVGTLRFSAGETSKTIYIPIVDDAYPDGSETFTISLSNPTGADLGTSVGTITIQDDSQPTSHPMDTNAFFVRQHYIDFLGREPEPQGLQDWQNILANCGTTVALPCDRIEVSSAFFRSPEFQSRGYFIYRFYSSVGRIPLYPEFMPDFAKVSGFLNDSELEANKAAFVVEFMARPEFVNKYNALNTDAAGFVDAVLQTLGLPNHPLRQSYINQLNSNNNSQHGRALVLRTIVESGEVYNKYYNEAFVIMQYFGYLRRTADASYVDWIKTMNETGGDYRTMINGFLNSPEYRQRFGP